MAVRKQRAAYRKKFEISKNYDIVLTFAKRYHREDKIFYIVKGLYGFYSDMSIADFNTHTYNTFDKWEFIKNKWVKTEEV